MSKDDLIARLDVLKEKQDEVRRDVDRLEGRKAQLLQQLSEQFGVQTLEEAQEKLASMQKDLARRRSRAERLLEELEAAVKDA